MQSSKQKWKDMAPGRRVIMVLGAVAQLILLTLAQRDLSARPAAQVRGPKPLWRIVTLVNFVGPLAYFCCGRKKEHSQLGD